MSSQSTGLRHWRQRFNALFQDHEIFIRTHGHVRFLRISAVWQKRVALIAGAVLLAWAAITLAVFVNQLLTELDGVGSDNEGVFVLAATNHPWDVDPALRRPGRLDRTLLVLPPDREAREAILRTHLRDRPVERIDTRRLAKATEGFSGADLAHLCESASENALMESVGSGQVRMIGMPDFDRALSQIRPSIGPWVETARNVALYANASGEYDELARWLRKRR